MSYVSGIKIIREADVFIPVMVVHQDSCNPPKKCCRWEYERCMHLARTNLNDAKALAMDLAKRAGVPYG